jgi:hypothetical protein
LDRVIVSFKAVLRRSSWTKWLEFTHAQLFPGAETVGDHRLGNVLFDNAYRRQGYKRNVVRAVVDRRASRQRGYIFPVKTKLSPPRPTVASCSEMGMPSSAVLLTASSYSGFSGNFNFLVWSTSMA